MELNRKTSPVVPHVNSTTRLAWWHRRWVRRLLAATVVLGLVAAMHRPLLKGVAEFLIVDTPAGPADYFVLLPEVIDSRAAADEALRRYAAGEIRGILLFQPPMSRAVRCGAWPDRATELRRDLEQRGVPPTAIVVPPGPCRTSRDAAETLRIWLQNRPATRLIVMDRLLRGRYDRRIFNAVFDTRQAAGLQFTAMRTGIDENNWWQSREGIQMIFQNYAALVFDGCSGQSEQCRDPWTMEEFERSLPLPRDN
jgi:hypothetical protein